MAAAMQAKGLSKYNGSQGNRNYHNWKVTLEDLYQWIGVWIYMLAFPQAGSRRDYFTERPGGYGPRHRKARAMASQGSSAPWGGGFRR
eukprot:3150876-Prymnesium_polylepis.1